MRQYIQQSFSPPANGNCSWTKFPANFRCNIYKASIFFKWHGYKSQSAYSKRIWYTCLKIQIIFNDKLSEGISNEGLNKGVLLQLDQKKKIILQTKNDALWVKVEELQFELDCYLATIYKDRKNEQLSFG